MIESEIEFGLVGEFPYSIHKHPRLGHLCGYIAVPPAHPWFGKDYDDLDVDVHGGLTYAKDGKETDYPHALGTEAWWHGFDCAHSGDISPGIGHIYPGDVYRDRDYVFAEIERLAQQAADAWMRALPEPAR